MVQISADREKIAEFCRAHNIRRLSIFGSVLREDFGPTSDVDVLVEFAPTSISLSGHHGSVYRHAITRLCHDKLVPTVPDPRRMAMVLSNDPLEDDQKSK